MTSTCEWCGAGKAPEAVKCPNCRSWRKDVGESRMKSYVFLGTAGALGGFLYGWGHWSAPGNFFSLEEFVLSISGWVVIALAAFGTYFGIKVSRELGTWWWM